MAKVAARRAGSTSHVWGYVIVLLAALVFISFIWCSKRPTNALPFTINDMCCVPDRYVMVFSKLLLLLPEAAFPISQEADGTTVPNSQRESEGFGLLLALESDVYYCFLVPLTIPVTILACYANWVSLKFFRHN
ncbi:Phosphatidylinositol N-acetylglucosaminyltransferase subunit Y [Phytophthora cactorum]|nr:Phosphatidylinositol N-acetylglucosaminyltransferase subunit Y [Phytophthora cactorum]